MKSLQTALGKKIIKKKTSLVCCCSTSKNKRGTRVCPAIYLFCTCHKVHLHFNIQFTYMYIRITLHICNYILFIYVQGGACKIRIPVNLSICRNCNFPNPHQIQSVVRLRGQRPSKKRNDAVFFIRGSKLLYKNWPSNSFFQTTSFISF